MVIWTTALAKSEIYTFVFGPWVRRGTKSFSRSMFLRFSAAKAAPALETIFARHEFILSLGKTHAKQTVFASWYLSGKLGNIFLLPQ